PIAPPPDPPAALPPAPPIPCPPPAPPPRPPAPGTPPAPPLPLPPAPPFPATGASPPPSTAMAPPSIGPPVVSNGRPVRYAESSSHDASRPEAARAITRAARILVPAYADARAKKSARRGGGPRRALGAFRVDAAVATCRTCWRRRPDRCGPLHGSS